MAQRSRSAKPRPRRAGSPQRPVGKHPPSRSAEPSGHANRDLALAMARHELGYRWMFEHSLNAGIVLDRQGRAVAVNPAATKITGYPAAALCRMSISDVIAPDHRDADLARYAQVLRGQPQQTETVILHQDGRRLEVFVHAAPLVDQGRIVGALVILRDISRDKSLVEQLRQSEERYRNLAEANGRLLQELEHRVRNNLAELSSLIDLTCAGASSLDSFAAALRDRVRAMAQTHTVLAASHWGEVDLRWLTERLFEGLRLGAAHAVPVALEGPRVMVGPHQAHPLALMLCELYTNSCKHGAHSRATGRVRVRWDLAAGGEPGRVRLRWTESGGPPVRPPGAPGLGLNLIRGFSEYDLHGRCELRFPPRGVDHVFEFTAGGGAPTRGGGPC